MLENAIRICEAKFGHIVLLEGNLFRMVVEADMPAKLAEFFRQRGPFEATPGSHLDRVMRTKQVSYTADDAAEAVQGIAAKYGGARSIIAVPMLKEDDLIGAIMIYRQEVRPFSDKQIELVQNFAAQAVIAIENARLLNELRQRTDDVTEVLEQQTATSEVLRVISSSPGELEPVFQAMLENARRICEAKFGVLYRCEGDAFRTVAMHGAPQSYVEERRKNPVIRPPPATTLGRALATKQPAQIADVMNEPHYFDAPSGYSAVLLAKLSGARTVLAVPMLKENELIGAIVIYRTEVRPISDKQIELVNNFAAQAVIAIENTRLLNELRESLQQQTATSEVLKIISSSPGDLQPVFTAMLENAVRICEAKFGTLTLFDGDAFRIVAVHKVPPAFAEVRLHGLIRPHPKGGHAELIRTKRVVHIDDLRLGQPYREGDPAAVAMVELGGARTTMLAPMLKEDVLVGTINILRDEVRSFTDKQIELVQNFAAQAVIAIENTRLLNELRESLQQQTATSEVLQVISSSPGELQPVFNAMLEAAARLCEADHGTIAREQDGA